ncbi:hypothetical protein Hanom_Chr12g01124631 [Helianthus anomalus]
MLSRKGWRSKALQLHISSLLCTKYGKESKPNIPLACTCVSCCCLYLIICPGLLVIRVPGTMTLVFLTLEKKNNNICPPFTLVWPKTLIVSVLLNCINCTFLQPCALHWIELTFNRTELNLNSIAI